MTQPPAQPDSGGWGQLPGNTAGPGGQQPGAPAPQPANPQPTNPQPTNSQPTPDAVPQQQPAWYGNQHTELHHPVDSAGQQRPAFPEPGAPVPRPNLAPGGGQPSWQRESEWDRNEFNEQVTADPPRRPWPWLLAGLLVVLAGIAGAYFVFVPADPGPPRPVAQDVVNKVNAKQFDALRGQLCQDKRAELAGQLDQLKAGTFQVELTEVSGGSGTAQARLAGTFELNGAILPVDQTLGLVAENGAWKVCSLG